MTHGKYNRIKPQNFFIDSFCFLILSKPAEYQAFVAEGEYASRGELKSMLEIQ